MLQRMIDLADLLDLLDLLDVQDLASWNKSERIRTSTKVLALLMAPSGHIH
jgi:hypothetical protein